MPANIESALNGLLFTSINYNTLDTVNITLYDGSGGSCLNNTLLGPGSYRPTCFITSATFQVQVLPLNSVGTAQITSNSSASDSLSFKIKLIAGCIGGFMALGGLRCLQLRRLHNKKKL